MAEKQQGLKLQKYFSFFGDPYKDSKDIMQYSPRDATVRNDKGEIVEKIDKVVFPSFWTLNASNTVATKYFRRTDVPETGREVDVRQLVKRVAGTISEWGTKQNYFDKREAKKFEEEVAALNIGQYGSFNSPVWFNLGLDKYGLNRKEDNFYHVNEKGKLIATKNIHANPQCSACFIVSPEDNIPSMMEVSAIISSRIFKQGSGIGGDWSHVRSAGESISGGGGASGAKRFMDVQDAAARVIKSGGISRRAAVMQSIAIWHPDAEEVWIDKYKQEQNARRKIEAGAPNNWESHTIQDLRGQNVNISTRIDDEFWHAYEQNKPYAIRRVVDGFVVKEENAKSRLEKMAFATDGCGDPGCQNHTIINKYNTCKNSGEIWASNPCSEYMFLNNSACNLASLNLMRFRKTDGEFDLDSFCKAVDIYLTSQDILVSQASYPSKEIAWNSHSFRPLGLGYANLGAYLMSLGFAYDSDEARNFASAVTSLMTAEAYLQSSVLAEKIGSFLEFKKNKEPMLEVIEMHRKAARKIPQRNGLEKIINAANKKWDEVVERGQKYGFRNAQVTLLAPTGTIGFMMGCDTTGCEPTYSLKAYKELSGGGIMKIVNQIVPLALEKLGYDKEKIKKVLEYIDKNETIEGCVDVKEEHIPIFDCSVTSGNGKRAISPMGHIKMLGAIQPHLSGAISKTINCPESTSVEEIKEMFYQGWKNGVKAIAIYRDGAKIAQPLKARRGNTLEQLSRGEREPLPALRLGITQKVKIGGTSLFLRTGEYEDGRIGEIFIDSLERGSEVNRLLNLAAIQFSQQIQHGTSLIEALEPFGKAGLSQISGITDHSFIKIARGIEGFLFDWILAHYRGDISFVQKEPEMRPLPWELRVYKQVPKLHLFPTVEGTKFYPDVPSLEETIKRISGTNYWNDTEEGLDTRKTIEKIKRNRIWKNENTINLDNSGRTTGRTCNNGHLMISDGSCWKCPICKTTTGGCGS